MYIFFIIIPAGPYSTVEVPDRSGRPGPCLELSLGRRRRRAAAVKPAAVL